MAVPRDIHATGARVESLLDELRSRDPHAGAVAEELVGCLVDLYGAGLERVVAILGTDAEVGPRMLDQLTADPLVESLLLVHDLHPLDIDTRIQRALDRVRPYLGSHAGGVDYRGVDSEGVVHLRLEGSCNGCPSSTVTVRLTIEQAIAAAAPEAVRVDVEGVTEASSGPPLLQITTRRREPAEIGASHTDIPIDGGGWASLPQASLPAGSGPHSLVLGGRRVVLCRVGGELYAYGDACPACGASLAGGSLTAGALRCADCGARFDVRIAGAGLDETRQHLDPLPLLADGDAVRIAAGALAAVGT